LDCESITGCVTDSVCDASECIEMDCFGVCGGDAVEDCFGFCGGSGELDECGVCGGDGSTCGTICDIDGNCYQTIQIGDQLWMAENLKVTHYRDGSEIPYPSDEDWGSYDEGQYSVYDNDPSNADIYGNLYNFAVVDDDRGVCPDGWHVPSDAEYTILTDYLGGESVAGGKMKSTGTIEDGDGLWNYYSDEITEEATNESGFTGLPAGYRDYDNGYYLYMGSYGSFWSSSEYFFSNFAWLRTLYSSNSNVYRYDFYKQSGFSIRCLKD